MLKNKIVLIFLVTSFTLSFIHFNNFSSFYNTNTNQITELTPKGSIIINKIDHIHYNISSQYEVIVHQVEPVRTGSDNDIMLMINQFLNGGANKTPVVSAEQNLSISILREDVVFSTPTLIPSDTKNGTYFVPFKPVKAGSYFLHITGVLGTNSINENIPLEKVSSLSDNLFWYFVLPIGLITIGGFIGIILLKRRNR